MAHAFRIREHTPRMRLHELLVLACVGEQSAGACCRRCVARVQAASPARDHRAHVLRSRRSCLRRIFRDDGARHTHDARLSVEGRDRTGAPALAGCLRASLDKHGESKLGESKLGDLLMSVASILLSRILDGGGFPNLAATYAAN
jgi:hypothetical protein